MKTKLNTTHGRRSKNLGFTLPELLVTTAILGLLSAIAIPNLLGARDGAKDAKCVTNLQTINSAKHAYASEHPEITGSSVITALELAPFIQGGVDKCFCSDDPSKAFASSYDPGSMTNAPTCLASGGAHSL